MRTEPPSCVDQLLSDKALESMMEEMTTCNHDDDNCLALTLFLFFFALTLFIGGEELIHGEM